MPLIDKLAEWWKLGESTGSSRVGSHASTSLTSNGGVTAETGKLGGGAGFSTASSQYLSAASSAIVEFNGTALCFSFWVKFTGTGNQVLVGKDVDSPANSRDYTIDVDSGDLRCYWNGGGSGALLVHSATIATGVWYFIVVKLVSVGGGAYAMFMSLDGGAFEDTGSVAVTPQVSSAEFRVGARAYSGFEGYANCIIDELALWDQDLTDADVDDLYNSGNGITYDNLLGFAAGTTTATAASNSSVTISDAACTGGTAPFSYQRQKSSTVGGTYSNVGSAVSGVGAGVAPSNTTDTGLTLGDVWWYRTAITDDNAVTIYSNPVPVVVRVGSDYFIDPATGSDSNTGLSGAPWETSAAANSWKFVAGDTLSLNRGQSYAPLLIQLATHGVTPTSSSRLTIGAYGAGAAPLVNAGVTDYGVKVLNLPYTTVQDLEVFGATVTFTPGSPNTVSFTNTGYGIQFLNTGGAALSGCIARRNEVHGLYWGIVFGDREATNTFNFSGALCYENEVYDINDVGIALSNFTNYTPTAFTNCEIYQNHVYQVYGDYTGSSGGNTGYGIQIPSSTGTLVERNLIYDCGAASTISGGGPTAIIGAGTHDSIIRGNTILRQSSQAADGGAIHFDGNGCLDNIVERNLCVDCKEGIVCISIGGSTTSTVVRYNIVENCTLALRDEATSTLYHNNTVFQGSGSVLGMNSAVSGIKLYNNILRTTSGTLGTANSGVTLNGNLYDCTSFSITYNGNARTSLAAFQSGDSQEADGLTGSALFSDEGNAPNISDPATFASTVTAYDLGVGSDALGAGQDLQAVYSIDPGPADFHYVTSWDGFNVGAVETELVGTVPVLDGNMLTGGLLAMSGGLC